jgi:hypothetical protein
MCKEKRVEICLNNTGNVVNNGVINEFFNANQANFELLNLGIRFKGSIILALNKTEVC